MNKINRASMIDTDKFELISIGEFEDYDLYYNQDTGGIALENYARVIKSDNWMASYTGCVTYRNASYYERVIDTLVKGDTHIDDWDIWSVDNRGFGFDDENHKPIEIYCEKPDLEGFHCGIILTDLHYIEKSDSQRQRYINNDFVDDIGGDNSGDEQ